GQLSPASDRRTKAPNTITPSASATASHARRWKWRAGRAAAGRGGEEWREAVMQVSCSGAGRRSDQLQELGDIGAQPDRIEPGRVAQDHEPVRVDHVGRYAARRIGVEPRKRGAEA